LEIVSRTAKETFIPITVGGGLRTIGDIKEALRAGADKVSLNTAAIKEPNIIKEASLKFGSSTIVVSIEAIRQQDGRYLAYTDNGREYTGIEVLEWARRVEELGAGEILLVSIDREGTGSGYDLSLTKMVSEAVSIPVIACGGAGKLEDVKDVIDKGKADAVCLASILHYDFIKKRILDKKLFDSEGNIEYLKSGRSFSKIQTADLREIKAYLHNHNIGCRNFSDSEVANA
jgi:cyclase